MSFGKKPSSAPLAPVGAHVRAPIANPEPASSPIDQRRAAMEARGLELQRTTRSVFAGAQMRPYFLIPASCWVGLVGKFLTTTLELYQHDNWNVMFLAADEATSSALDIALHPNAELPAFIHAATQLMDECQLNMNGAHNEAARTGNFTSYNQARDEARERVKLLAGLFARQIVEAWQRRSAARSA